MQARNFSIGLAFFCCLTILQITNYIYIVVQYRLSKYLIPKTLYNQVLFVITMFSILIQSTSKKKKLSEHLTNCTPIIYPLENMLQFVISNLPSSFRAAGLKVGIRLAKNEHANQKFQGKPGPVDWLTTRYNW